jgi:hypothetical protein
MPFMTPLITRADEGTQWILEEPLVYAMPDLRITVPARFVCDLASIPRVFRLVIPVNDRHRQAAVLHDWLYYKRGKLPSGHLTRAQCDRIFLNAMAETGVPRWKRYSMYFAVRAGGYVAWAT